MIVSGVTGTLSARSTAGGGLGTDFELAGGLQAVLCFAHRVQPAVSFLHLSKGRPDGRKSGHEPMVSVKDHVPTLTTGGAPGAVFVVDDVLCLAHGQGGAELGTDRSPTLTCNHEAPIAVYPLLEVGKRTGPCNWDDPRAGLGVGELGAPMFTLQANAQHGVCIGVYAFQPRIARNGRGDMGDLVNALTAQAGETGKGDAAPCVAAAFAFKASHFTRGKDGAPACVTPPLSADADKGDQDTLVLAPSPVVAFSCKDYGGDAAVEIAPTIRAMGHSASHANAGGQVAIAFQERGRSGVRVLDVGGDLAYALTAVSGGGRAQERNVVVGMAVRRLTPVECERLQGFPDGWTQVPHRGKPAADGPRYKALGNSMAVPCMAFIGRRIDAALNLL